MSIPFIDLKAQYQALQPQIQERMNRVLEHGQYIMGPEVKELEDKLQTYTGAKHCITVASGTEALLICLMALGIEPGDEIITTPFTFVATAEVIVLLGAKPVFVDIEPDTCNIDASKIEAKITSKTKAIMPVSLYGQVADMNEINAIAAKNHLPVIEDAAQSFGAEYKGNKSCNLSTIGCTSFFPSKPLGCYGDGGAIFTNDDSLAKACREIRVHGQSQRYVHTRVGVGGRMDTLQCAVLLAKLERFDWEIAQRQRIGQRYNDLIANGSPQRFVLRDHAGKIGGPCDDETSSLRGGAEPSSSSLRGGRRPTRQSIAAGDIRLVSVRPDRASIYAQYTVLVSDRDALQKRLSEAGIPTAVHYPVPLNEQPAYKHLCCPDCTPIAQQISKQVMSLPMSPDLSAEDQDKIVSALLA
jgi:UDP-2-acetamido-2-deoxy-ribo-hexuluronate aminotransferase